MIVAALLVFGALLVAWLLAPTDARRQPDRRGEAPRPADPAPEALAKAA